jgi:hypothetical protein
MVSVRQVHFIEEHWESIAARALARIRRETPHSHAFSDSMISERVEDLLAHLGDWLTAPDPELLARYEDVGYKRAAAHVHLHDLVRILQIIRLCAIDYVRENELNDSSITLRAENELEYNIDRFFDLVIYHTVKGYEAALRGKPLAAAHAN